MAKVTKSARNRKKNELGNSLTNYMGNRLEFRNLQDSQGFSEKNSFNFGQRLKEKRKNLWEEFNRE